MKLWHGLFETLFRGRRPSSRKDVYWQAGVRDLEPLRLLSTTPFAAGYVSSGSGGAVDGISFRDEDILKYDNNTDTWSMYFDGSDVGLGSKDVDAFHLLPNGNILLSVDAPLSLGNLGLVDDSDIVKFTPSSLGANTAGGFAWYLDGSDVGLSTNAEDVDAIGFAPDGRLVVSVTGNFRVSGPVLTGHDRDLIAFNKTKFGKDTVGNWEFYFDGSDVGLASTSEDIKGTWIDSTSGDIYLTTLGNFSANGVNGDLSDIFRFDASSSGPNTSGTFSSFWDGSANGFGGELLDGIVLQRSVAPPPGTDPPTGDVFYVDKNHPSASNNNSGSENSPWRTITHGLAQARAGDTIYVKRGNYGAEEPTFTRSGTPSDKIVLSAYPGHEREVIIRGGSISSYGKSHIVINGFKVVNAPRFGIRIVGPENSYGAPAKDITISNNWTYNTWSSGISIWGVKWGDNPGNYDNLKNVFIENNLVQLGTNGGQSEIITVANGVSNVHVRYNEISIGDPNMTGGDEGIDFKEGVRDGFIYGNYIHDLSDKAIYIDGGRDYRHGGSASTYKDGSTNFHDPLVTNIQIYDNIIENIPAAAISIVTEGVGDVSNVKVFDNVVRNVTGHAYLVYAHPLGLNATYASGQSARGTISDIDFYDNIACDVGLAGFRVDAAGSNSIGAVLWRDNIVSGHGSNSAYRPHGQTTQINNVSGDGPNSPYAHLCDD